MRCGIVKLYSHTPSRCYQSLYHLASHEVATLAFDHMTEGGAAV